MHASRIIFVLSINITYNTYMPPYNPSKLQIPISSLYETSIERWRLTMMRTHPNRQEGEEGRLGDEGGGGSTVVLEGGGDLLLGLVVPGQPVKRGESNE
jgi:hypothetical protein